MSEVIRYAAAACQTDLVNPVDRAAMRGNTDRMLSMIDSAVAGSAPFLPVRLVVFLGPEQSIEYRFQAWRFAAARGRSAFVLTPKPGMQVIEAH